MPDAKFRPLYLAPSTDHDIRLTDKALPVILTMNGKPWQWGPSVVEHVSNGGQGMTDC